ncbi:hypothetical protein DL771_000420 [Monosporascus sp. 5C6A]|nr:hypothetical protein DL771_000420 [Monosporascus sp. 5C6A]
MEFMCSSYLVIRPSAEKTRGLGIFARLPIPEGLRILHERPLITADSSDEGMAGAYDSFQSMRDDDQNALLRLFAGVNDVVPLLPEGRIRDDEARSEDRIQNIAHFNGIEGQGVGYFLSFSVSFINHSYVYYNDVSGCITLHALRRIAQDEEITISYFQENPYQTKNERNQQLAKRSMVELRRRLTTYNQNNNASEESHYEAITNLRELVTCMEEETMESLELSLCYLEQARILSLLGDERARRDKARKALQLRLLCLGADHPSSADLALQVHE